MEIALGILAGILFVVIVAGISFMSIILIKVVRDMKEILTLTQVNTGKISSIDNLLIAVHSFLVQEMLDGPTHARAERMPHPGWEEMGIAQEDGKFITEDGIHSADSFEELIGKITKDPRYRVNRPEDIEEIRQKFEDFNEKYGPHDDDQGMGPDGPEGIAPGDEWKESL